MARVMFDNGWGASIIQTPHSYGGTEGMYELKVVRADKVETPYDEVRGWLTPEKVDHHLITIQNMPRIERKDEHADQQGARDASDAAGK